MISLVLLMLLVSCTALLLQTLAMVHLIRQRASYKAEELAARSYVRTVACRVMQACIYVAVASLQAADVHVLGIGGVGPETLVILSGVQLMWLVNSALDISTRRHLRAGDPQTVTHGQARTTRSRIVALFRLRI